MAADADQALFAYGVLRDADVQLDTFGRRVDAVEDVLPGHRLEYARTEDAGVGARPPGATHPFARRTGDPRDKILGGVLRVTAAELDAADEYHLGRYRRASVTLLSGTRAWIYVGEPPAAGAD
ncbi:gamma-glutamylcyclotransferase family protein [Microbacterium sp. SORGH_AS_0888]|uniref:gamma-glutamylcyclotransferase family protein n=1 Tax=Microbacterium sp. SORGH_AS_0888 TaxID=3041791 RepID=UPI0027847BA8|nr:gamma-glutamylcyclotransferase family protein [Microbacterium sp. SORGH_AS_0888]MDQ1129213.1 hypothetical protein [Microbacterium sp. SORGH_AS_0888]